MRKSCFPAILLSVCVLIGGPALADSVSDFYKGKAITLYVGYSPGGGYDTYARTVARHIGKHIPGNPDIVVKNRPGAGSMKLANEIYNILPKDGTALAIIGRGQIMEPLFGTKEAKFDPSKYLWLGSANNEVSVCVSWHKTPIKTYKDLLSQQMIVGGTGPGADTDTFPRVMNNLLGTKLKLVTGYPGGNDVLLAMERGEVQGRCGYSWSSAKSRKAKWLKEKKMRVLVQMSTAKHPDLPDVPFIMDLAKSDYDRKVMQLIFARQAWGRPFVGPPGVPADRAKALKAAFMATMKDPAFLADAKKQRLEVAPISGDEVKKLVAEIYNAPKELITAAKEAGEKSTNIQVTKAVIPIVIDKGAIITGLKNGARSVSYKAGGKKGKVSVSGSKTKVTIAGKTVKRKALKVDMTCDITRKGSAAKEIACN